MGGGSRISDSKRQQAGFGSSDDAVRLSQPVPRRVLPPTSGPACLPSSPPSRQWHPSMRVCVRVGQERQRSQAVRRQPVCVDKVSTDSPPRRRRRNWDAPCPAHPSPCQGLFTQSSSANVCRRSKLGDCCQPEGWRLAPAVQREQAAAAAVRKMQTMLCGAACRCCSIRATAARTNNSRGCRAYQTPCRWPPGTNHQSFAALPRCARQDRPSGGRRAAAALPFIF
jgi:hypothetical protein